MAKHTIHDVIIRDEHVSFVSQTGGRVMEKSHVESLATASSGDLRGAINALQFSCLQCEYCVCEIHHIIPSGCLYCSIQGGVRVTVVLR